jgi:hypothetical protein
VLMVCRLKYPDSTVVLKLAFEPCWVYVGRTLGLWWNELSVELCWAMLSCVDLFEGYSWPILTNFVARRSQSWAYVGSILGPCWYRWFILASSLARKANRCAFVCRFAAMLGLLLVHSNGVFCFHLLYLFAFILLTLVPQRVWVPYSLQAQCSQNGALRGCKIECKGTRAASLQYGYKYQYPNDLTSTFLYIIISRHWWRPLRFLSKTMWRW